MKPLRERNPLAVGLVGTTVLTVGVATAFFYDKLPFISGTADYSAYFTESGGIGPGSPVRISGFGVGTVSDVRLDGTLVRIDFTARKDVELGDRTEAAIRTETILGSKMVELTPRGDGRLGGAIPVERTTSPYDLPTALGDLTTAISGLDTTQLSSALTMLAETFRDTPADLKTALEGVSRFSDTLNQRDDQLRNLLANANKVTGVLAQRSDQVAALVVNTNALLAELLAQQSSLDAFMTNIAAVSHQISGLVADNREQLQPAVDKLNGVLEILDTHKAGLQRTLSLLKRYSMSFGESVGSGPFFKAYIANLLPGQFTQPAADALLGNRPLDPNTPLPSDAVAPQSGSPANPPAPLGGP